MLQSESCAAWVQNPFSASIHPVTDACCWCDENINVDFFPGREMSRDAWNWWSHMKHMSILCYAYVPLIIPAAGDEWLMV